ncbi:hypothetical protein JHK87_033373 [Glycine soja]|nr:hypothetical protein JHK87_033373 [Glycine soja]
MDKDDTQSQDLYGYITGDTPYSPQPLVKEIQLLSILPKLIGNARITMCSSPFLVLVILGLSLGFKIKGSLQGEER